MSLGVHKGNLERWEATDKECKNRIVFDVSGDSQLNISQLSVDVDAKGRSVFVIEHEIQRCVINAVI